MALENVERTTPHPRAPWAAGLSSEYLEQIGATHFVVPDRSPVDDLLIRDSNWAQAERRTTGVEILPEAFHDILAHDDPGVNLATDYVDATVTTSGELHLDPPSQKHSQVLSMTDKEQAELTEKIRAFFNDAAVQLSEGHYTLQPKRATNQFIIRNDGTVRPRYDANTQDVAEGNNRGERLDKEDEVNQRRVRLENALAVDAAQDNWEIPQKLLNGDPDREDGDAKEQTAPKNGHVFDSDEITTAQHEYEEFVLEMEGRELTAQQMLKEVLFDAAVDELGDR